MDTIIGETLKGIPSDSPYVGQAKVFKRLAPFLLIVDETDAMIAPVCFGELTPQLGQCLCRGDADADRDVGPQSDFLRYATHKLTEVIMLRVAAKVAKALVYAVVFDAQDTLPQDTGHAPAHCGVEPHISRENLDTMAADEVMRFEQGSAAPQSDGFGLRCQSNDAAVVAGKDADRLSLKTWVKHFLYRTEKAVAIYERIHGWLGMSELTFAVCG